MNDSKKVEAGRIWERPTLYRLDAADAQLTGAAKVNDGMNNKS
jgi:hypothetical protein